MALFCIPLCALLCVESRGAGLRLRHAVLCVCAWLWELCFLWEVDVVWCVMRVLPMFVVLVFGGGSEGPQLATVAGSVATAFCKTACFVPLGLRAWSQVTCFHTPSHSSRVDLSALMWSYAHTSHFLPHTCHITLSISRLSSHTFPQGVPA